MKQTSFDPVVLRKKAADYQKLAKKHYDLARAIERSGLYSPDQNGSKAGKNRRSVEWRRQQSEKLKRYWAEKKRKTKNAKAKSP